MPLQRWISPSTSSPTRPVRLPSRVRQITPRHFFRPISSAHLLNRILILSLVSMEGRILLRSWIHSLKPSHRSLNKIPPPYQMGSITPPFLLPHPPLLCHYSVLH